MRTIANMTVLVPCDAVETEKALLAAVKKSGPVYIRLGRAKVPVILKEKEPFEIGKGKVLKEGNDITIIACGIMVAKALEAYEKLKEKKISARIINMSTIKPIDENLILESAQKTKAIITAEEHTTMGGLGSAVAEVIVENFPVPMKILGIKNEFGESGKPEELLKRFGLTSDDIVKAVEEIIDLRRGK